jgi:AraC family transcriptional regulator
MKRTLNEEIVRLRMESVKSLLTTTSLKVVEVAAASGFARPSHLFRTFRKQLGLSPKAYRKRKAAKTGPPASPRARR